MKIWILLLSIFFLKCNADINADFKLQLTQKNKKYTPNDSLRFKLINKKNHPIDSVVFRLNGKRIRNEHPLIDQKLGIFRLTSSVFVQGKEYQQQEQLSVVSSNKPKLYSYTIVNEYPHDKTAYTQGLEFYRDTLYESTGLRGKSSLRKVNYQTGELYQQITLDKVYFGEGISFLNEKLYQLTWQGNIGFQYEPNKLSMERSFAYQKSKEGWGLCNDGLRLYKSDGTHHIWLLDPEKQQEIGSIQVMTDKKAISKINELEWVNGKIYANTYQMSKEVGIIIDPNSGAVEGVIDFSGLKEKVEQVSNLDVLNGIAYHPKKQSFFVTGKNWSKLFEVKITPKK